jgi:hypothetical protein
MVVNITTNANTNYVQEGSYAIEQRPVALKATMPTAAQKAASPNRSQPYRECAPSTPVIHENGKQHHVALDHQDPNDLIPSDNTDGCTSADHQGQPALPVGNTTGSTLTEGHHASVDTGMYVLAQPYESAFPPLGHIPSNSRMPMWEPARVQGTCNVSSPYATHLAQGLKTQCNGKNVLAEPTSLSKGHHDLPMDL